MIDLVHLIDLKLLALAFVTVFVSELGDKSQIAAIALGCSTKSIRAAFLGTALALVLASFIGVWIGGGMGYLLPTRWVKAIAAVGFIIMAVRLLLEANEDDEDNATDMPETSNS